MREILFRGKRIDNGEWVYGYYVTHRDVDGNILHYISVPTETWGTGRKYYIVDPDTIGQYTGLTANGKKIFEGSIISSGYFRNFFVEYSEEDAEYQANFGDSFGSLATYLNPKKSTVIGNVHDNSELLEDNP